MATWGGIISEAHGATCPSGLLSVKDLENSDACDLTGMQVQIDSILLIVPKPGDSVVATLLPDTNADKQVNLATEVNMYSDARGGTAVSLNNQPAIGERRAAAALNVLQLARDETVGTPASTGLSAAVPTYCGEYYQYGFLHSARWRAGYQWYYNPASEPSSTSFAAIRDGGLAILADSTACGSWPNTTSQYAINGTSRTTHVQDGYSVVGWGTLSSSAWAVTLAWYSGSDLLEADIRFNKSKSFFTGTGATPTTKGDLRSIAAHEIGHAFGLKDLSSTPKQIMYGSFAAGEQRRNKRTGDLYGMALRC